MCKPEEQLQLFIGSFSFWLDSNKNNACVHASSILRDCPPLPPSGSSSVGLMPPHGKAEAELLIASVCTTEEQKGKEHEWPVVGILGMLKLRFDCMLCTARVHRAAQTVASLWINFPADRPPAATVSAQHLAPTFVFCSLCERLLLKCLFQAQR